MMKKPERYKRGDTREDGMVFWAYAANCATGEYWITPEKLLEKRKADQLSRDSRVKNLQVSFNKLIRKYSEGHVRDDGMIFWCYNITSKGFEHWVTKEQYAVTLQMRKDGRNQRRQDYLYRITQNLRNRIYSSISKGGFCKTSKTATILGCSYKHFVNYITSQFTTGMTWDNYGIGGWELDHILPVSAATTEEEMIALNHFKNFQPLWSSENRRKKDNHCPKELAAYLESRLPLTS